MRLTNFVVAGLIVLAAIVVPAAADNATLTWYGNGAIAGGGGTWNATALDWSSDGVNFVKWPSAVATDGTRGDTAIFGGTGGVVTLDPAAAVGNITFTSTGYTLNASVLTIEHVVATNWVTNYTLNDDGNSVTVGSLAFIGGHNRLVKDGSGTLTITGASGGDWYAGVTLNNGTININNNLALGPAIDGGWNTANSFIINGGTIANTSGAAVTVPLNWAEPDDGEHTPAHGFAMVTVHPTYTYEVHGDFTVAGNADLTFGNATANAWEAANVGMNSNLALSQLNTTVTVADGRNFTINVDIVHDAHVDNNTGVALYGTTHNLIKAGLGTLTIQGASTVTGLTAVNAGKLVVAGTGSIAGGVQVNATGTLAGPGTVGGITVTGGTLAPSGAMYSTAGVSLDSASALAINVSANNASDLLAVTGAVTVAGKLIVTPSYTMAKGDNWTILAGTGVTGSYAATAINPTNNQVFSSAVSGGNSLTLTYLGLAREGDATKDGKIGADDLALVGLNWDPSGKTHTWVQGDFDGDGAIGPSDLADVGLNWAPAGYVLGSDVVQPAPEPVTMALLAIGGLGLLARRRK